jgi:uncharacterized protein YgiM (DUF1202 family)
MLQEGHTVEVVPKNDVIGYHQVKLLQDCYVTIQNVGL